MAYRITRRGSIKAFSAAVGMAALGRGGKAAAQSLPVVTFGGTIPFSGRWAEIGQSVHAGYQTVVKYVNEVQGGVDIGGKRHRLELKLVDDASDPQRATTLLQKQIDDDVQFFLGS